MKLCNILVDGACHLACDTATGLKNRISLLLQIPSLPMW